MLKKKYDPGFNKDIVWDIPLLEGYDYEFAENSASEKGSHHFRGIINPDLIDRVKEYDPDALLVYGWSFYSHLQLLRYFKGKKTIIVRGDSNMLDSIPFYKKWIRLLFLRWVYSHVDYALYVGKNNYTYYKKAGVEEGQLIRGPHAVDNKRFSQPDDIYAREALSLRNELKIPEEANVFLFAGKMEIKKDPGILLKAFVQAGMDKKGNHLVMVGNGPMEDQLKQEYEDNHAIHFMDFLNQSRMPVIYRLSDVFVLPSRGPNETWGLAVNEAMACGRAILVSDRCGCAADLVTPGKNGYIMKAGDLDDLMEKLQLLSGNKEAVKRMGKNSSQKIAEYSYEKLAEALERLLVKRETNTLCK